MNYWGGGLKRKAKFFLPHGDDSLVEPEGEENENSLPAGEFVENIIFTEKIQNTCIWPSKNFVQMHVLM